MTGQRGLGGYYWSYLFPGDFVVNLTAGRGYQYIQASIVVEVSTENVIDELEKEVPRLETVS